MRTIFARQEGFLLLTQAYGQRAGSSFISSDLRDAASAAGDHTTFLLRTAPPTSSPGGNTTYLCEPDPEAKSRRAGMFCTTTLLALAASCDQAAIHAA